MIRWSDKINKAYKIFNGVKDMLSKQNVDIDGVMEIFNNGTEQGALLKLFDSFNPEVDICIWAYLPSERDYNNQMAVLIGHHSDCTENNMWKDNVNPKIFTQAKAIDLHNEVRNYIVDEIVSRLDKRIEVRKEDN